MHKVSVKNFGMRCVSNFAAPKPYSEEVIQSFVSMALQHFANYGIGAQNFSKNESDRLFGYVISFSLFNGNVTFVLNRDGLVSTLLNGESQRDAELLIDLFTGAQKCLPSIEKLTHTINCFCHAQFVGENSVESVFKGMTVTTGPVKAVGITVLSEDPIEALLPVNERLRLEVSPSEVRENHLFLAWRFTASGTITDEYWKEKEPRLRAIAGSLGIDLV
jgi:hypothetical protein